MLSKQKATLSKSGEGLWIVTLLRSKWTLPKSRIEFEQQKHLRQERGQINSLAKPSLTDRINLVDSHKTKSYFSSKFMILKILTVNAVFAVVADR